MGKHTECTAYEAAAIYELNYTQTEDFSGPLLVADLDRAGVAICRCQPGSLPRQVWATEAGVTEQFFPALVRNVYPACTNTAEAAHTLYEAAADPRWVRAQKSFIRSGRTGNIPLPPVAISGASASFGCSALHEVFNRHWYEPLRRVLTEARAQLDSMPDNSNRRIVLVGSLSRVFLAEYCVREAFLAMPMLADEGLRTYDPQEDPCRIVAQGMDFFQAAVHKPKELEHGLMIQVHKRSGDKLMPSLLTLAAKGTTFDQMRTVNWVGPICLSSNAELALYADSRMHPITIPAAFFTGNEPLTCVEAGVAAQDEDHLALRLRNAAGTTHTIPLNFI